MTLLLNFKSNRLYAYYKEFDPRLDDRHINVPGDDRFWICLPFFCCPCKLELEGSQYFIRLRPSHYICKKLAFEHMEILHFA